MEKDNVTQTTETGEFSFRDLILQLIEWWRYLYSKWVIIVCVSAFTAAIGVTIVWLSDPLYSAQLTFALEEQKSGGGISSALGLASQFGLDLNNGGQGEFSGDNLIELMKSRRIVEMALLYPVTINSQTTTLADFYVDFNKIRKAWQKNPRLANIHFLPLTDRKTFSLQQDSILGNFYKALLANNLSVSKTDKKLSIVSIKVTSKNELFSKYFAEALEKVTSDFYVHTKTERAQHNFNILKHQTDSVRLALNSNMAGAASSADQNPNSNPLLQTLRVPSQRRQVEVTASVTILTELVKNLELARMSLLQETPLLQVIDSPILPLEKEKFGRSKGLLIGGLIGATLVSVFLILKRFFKNMFIN